MYVRTYIINAWRTCAARVIVVVLCVCVSVCTVCTCMCVHSYLPPHTLESHNRDTMGSQQYSDRFKFCRFS